MKLKQILKGYIGDKAFYKSVLAITLPMIIQDAVTNLVNLLDNLMVGSLGTEQMSDLTLPYSAQFRVRASLPHSSTAEKMLTE